MHYWYFQLFNKKKRQKLFQLNEDKYKNFQIFIKDKGLEKEIKSVLTNFSLEIKESQNNSIDISITIIKAAKQKNFKNYIIKERKSNINPNLKGKTIISNNLKDEINSKIENKKNTFNMKEDVDLSGVETSQNTIIEDENLINSIEKDPKLNFLLSKITGKNNKLENEIKGLKVEMISLKNENTTLKDDITSLKDEITSLRVKDSELEKTCGKLAGDIEELWNYFNLIAKGRDLSKSIVYFLYEYFGLTGEDKNDKKLSQIIDFIKDRKDTKNEINDKLEKFLYLNLFLNKFYNKIVHRDSKVKDAIK